MKDNSPESTTPTLLDVQIAFEHWRTHRSSQREPTPEHLRQLAIGLSGYRVIERILCK